MPGRIPDEDRQRKPLVGPYVVVPAVAALMAVGLAVVDPFRVPTGILGYLGLVPSTLGVGLVGWTVLTFRQTGETLSPVADPDHLVTEGPLAATRNPMYLGVVLSVVGVGVLAGSPVGIGYATLLAVAYHALVVFVEEPKLSEAFGDAYNEYCEEVPRWK